MLQTPFIDWIRKKTETEIPLNTKLLVVMDGDSIYPGTLTESGWELIFGYGRAPVEADRITHFALMPALPGVRRPTGSITREQGAFMAMQGFITRGWNDTNIIAEESIKAADELIRQLAQ